ncbi:sonic hedgehog protein-like [Babylonia areolata]|uniref:sonic hedgehog protein-like n=1 Tax=Babylonia areolata TaxID=304850 RepID=UPI003FD47CD7
MKILRGGGGRPQRLLCVLCLLLLLTPHTDSCGRLRGTGRRRRPRKLTPLVFKQHVPNVSENTLGASGIEEGPIKRSDPKFKDLVRNDNPDIKFRDEEGTGADRIMTQRCKDKLNTLAISVLNQWPGIKLRVTEAWDEDNLHAENSLHYEGRAVDITTSDRDKAKYGMLARLAVEAGFDWVYYESRGHIHCSVKSDSSVAIKIGGCFPGTSDVTTRGGGTKAMSDVRLGDEVLSVDSEGRLTYTEVIAFLDRDGGQRGYFYTLTTEHGASVTLTAKHLIYVIDTTTTTNSNNNVTGHDDVNVKTSSYSFSSSSSSSFFSMGQVKTLFAEEVREGHLILLASPAGEDVVGGGLGGSGGGGGGSFGAAVATADATTAAGGAAVTLSRVTHVQAGVRTGVYAPLTATGTIVVDGAVASCYAVINNPGLAHAVLAPLRGWHQLSSFVSSWLAPLSSSWASASASGAAPLPLPQYQQQQQPGVQENSIPADGVHMYAKLLYQLGSLLLSPDVLYVP